MKQLGKWVLLLSLLLVMRFTAIASDEAEHNALRNLKTMYENAINSRDLSNFAPYLDSNFSAVLATGDEVKGISGLKEYWGKIQKTVGPTGTYHVTLNPDRSLLLGNVAVALGTADELVHMSSNKDYHFHTSWTAVMKKEDGNWKVVRAQSTMDPFYNPAVTSAFKSAQFSYGLGGAGIGLVIGLLFGFLRRKKS